MALRVSAGWVPSASSAACPWAPGRCGRRAPPRGGGSSAPAINKVEPVIPRAPARLAGRRRHLEASSPPGQREEVNIFIRSPASRRLRATGGWAMEVSAATPERTPPSASAFRDRTSICIFPEMVETQIRSQRAKKRSVPQPLIIGE